MNRPWPTRVVLTLLVAAAGCQTARTAYYNAWEGMGYAKRERLVDNVKKAQAEQTEAKEQFTSALEEFKRVASFDGGELEKMYNQLNDAYEDCVGQADDVNSRIDSVKNVAASLFSEWQGEVKQIEDDDALQRQSQQLLDKTRDSYEEMIQRMDKAAASMQPVLKKFKNRVLFLKSNLNAQAIASLKDMELDLSQDIERLIREMESSIAEADKFIAEVSPAK